MTILVLIWMVFLLICEMFHARISLSLVLSLLLMNFVSRFGLELMYISLIENIRSCLIYLHGFQLHVLLPKFIEIAFFVCTKRITLLILKESLDRLVIVAEVLLKLPHLHANKTKESITSQKLGSCDFWRIANSVLNKGTSAIPPLLKDPEVLSSTSDKAKLFAENFL